MAYTLLRPCLSSSNHTAVRTFSTASTSRASILFQLGALSNSRETQHFNKISKLDRFEHSPNLKLIKTSEIDPFPVPLDRLLQNAPPPTNRGADSPSLVVQRSAFRRIGNNGPIWDARALAAGRAILQDTQRQRSRMARLVGRAKRREAHATRLLGEKVAALAHERQKLREEMRSAGYLILLSVATATGFAMWTFWPVAGAERVRDSADIGRTIAEKARGAIPLPSISAPVKEVVVAGGGAVPTIAAVTGEPTVAPAVVLKEEPIARSVSRWDWRNLFWKQL